MQILQNQINRLFQNVLTEHTMEDFQIHFLKKNAYLIKQGETVDDLIIVLDGSSKVTMDFENGTSVLVSFINGFYLLGDIEYIHRSPATCTVTILSDVTYLRIPYSILDSHYKKKTNFLNFLLNHISKKLLISNTRAQLNNVYSLRTRLSSYLYTISRYGEEKILVLPTLKDVSDNLCTSYRHLLRTINELQKENIISYSKRRIVIKNSQKLKELSRGNIYEEFKSESEI